MVSTPSEIINPPTSHHRDFTFRRHRVLLMPMAIQPGAILCYQGIGEVCYVYLVPSSRGMNISYFPQGGSNHLEFSAPITRQ